MFMDKRIRFRLNETLYDLEPGREQLALDWIRNVAGFKGTKEGCREGDCGACLVLMGNPASDGEPLPEWYSATSCTLALSDLDGRHVITIEGLATAGLTPVMKALLEEGASQCGFCSPGFVLALTGALVSGLHVDPVGIVSAIEGNLCRCTGYGSIRRAAARLAAEFADLPAALPERLALLAERGVLPPSLAALMTELPAAHGVYGVHGSGQLAPAEGSVTIGGGTDFFVRNPDPEPELQLQLVSRSEDSRHIRQLSGTDGRWLELGAGVTMTDFFASSEVRAIAPGIERFMQDIASPPIRNRATLAGNIANASPIADMTTMLIALGARLVLASPALPEAPRAASVREVDLCDFFLAYKKTGMRPEEYIAALRIPLGAVLFNFEKAARRARLDIASANSAIAVSMADDGCIKTVRVSAGGIAAVPLRLTVVEQLLLGQRPDAALIRRAGSLAAAAGTPMSDVRGSAEYRRKLMERFMWAHAVRLWPALKLEEELFA